ncbi:MAG: histidinol-phosphate transaminase [Clostridia bacterium]|nr:histidinol-phosphate transaminase [Clostridia bacterium]
MSEFLSARYENMKPYVPGEQPKDMQYIKLNTNENPFAPSSAVAKVIKNFDVEKLRLYPTPENKELKVALADYYKVEIENLFLGNGSDEVLALIFMAFFDKEKEVCYPDISYGFYPVYADLYCLKKNEIAVNSDFSIDVDAFIKTEKNIVIANPNAPTGMAISAKEIEQIVAANLKRLVVVDEAYIDFGGESVTGLVNKYRNLIVVQTFSKSRALAGARFGIAIADKKIIYDLEAIKFSFNSYNVNRLTEAVALEAIKDEKYTQKCVKEVIKNREWLSTQLKNLGFEVLPSSTNFVFARTNEINGYELYAELKRRGILIRQFNKERISEFVRITIGTMEQMKTLVLEIESILKK